MLLLHRRTRHSLGYRCTTDTVKHEYFEKKLETKKRKIDEAIAEAIPETLYTLGTQIQ